MGLTHMGTGTHPGQRTSHCAALGTMPTPALHRGDPTPTALLTPTGLSPSIAGVGASWEVLAPLILAFQESTTGAGLDINSAVSTSRRPAPSCRISHPTARPGAAAWGWRGARGPGWEGQRSTRAPAPCAEARAASSPPSPGAYLLGEGGGNVLTASACREGLLSGQNRLRWKTALQPRRKQRWRAG